MCVSLLEIWLATAPAQPVAVLLQIIYTMHIDLFSHFANSSQTDPDFNHYNSYL